MIISVIVPIYNTEKYIKECLDSLLNQNISKDIYEIICVDDGSIDRSGRIVDEYADKYSNIRVVHKINGGVSSARNEGLKLAKGDYIWFVDSDDIIIENTLSGVADYLKRKSPDLLFVKPIAFQDGADTSIYNNSKINSDETTEMYYDWLWTRFMKRELIINSGIRFNESISLAEDHMFCTLLNPYIKSIDTYDMVVYCYRIRENSASTTRTEDKLDSMIRTCKAFLDLSYDESINRAVAVNSVMEHLICIMAYVAKLPKNEAKKIIDILKKLELFPLKKSKSFTYDKRKIDDLDFDNRILIKLKHISYTRRGYYLLRGWRKFLKVKRRFF